ncbi:MAG: class I tRNA ligase family protein, partial [Actinobacteria bacterium]|nr:class I tRNA ligase family protein [Actinomycetota bacterium]
LWVALITAIRAVSPVMPFLTERLWRVLVAAPCPGAPDSVHLAGWPSSPGPRDEALLAEMAATRQVVEVGRRARGEAGVKLRQPLRVALVRGGDRARGHLDVIRDELRVKEVRFDVDTEVEVTIKPDFSKAGPRLGPKVKEVAAALERGDYEERDGKVVAAGEELSPEEVIRSERPVLEGWAVAHEGGVSVAVDPTLDDELILEGKTLELIRVVNDLRKQEGLELTDRIELRLPAEHAEITERHRDWIAAEVLATSVRIDETLKTPELEAVPAWS